MFLEESYLKEKLNWFIMFGKKKPKLKIFISSLFPGSFSIALCKKNNIC